MRKAISILFIAVLAITGGLTSGSVSAQFSSITCSPSGDFVTGGGFIIPDSSGAHANFGVAGGCKNGFLWGHLEYVDHGSTEALSLSLPTPFNVHGMGVTSYLADLSDPTKTRWIGGTAKTNDPFNQMVNYCVRVTDNGEGKSAADTFMITLFTTPTPYTASGTLVGGNIQLHKPDSSTPKGLECVVGGPL